MAQTDTPARNAVLIKYLNEAYGKEKQLETALQAQIRIVKRSQLKKGLQDHLKVTKNQSRTLQRRIKALGGKAETGPAMPGPEAVAGAAGAAANLANRAAAATKGPLQAIRGTSEADNDLRNVRDCLWNEAEEIAHYDVIESVANELGDKETVKIAKQFRREEERMQKLLERQIPQLVKAVIKEEVPAAERRASRNGGGRSRSAASSRSRSTRATSSSSKSSGTAAKTATRAKSTARAKSGTRAKSGRGSSGRSSS